MSIATLYCPKVRNIFGKRIDSRTIIPPTAYRLGYYAHNIKNYTNNKQHRVVVEIGAGFGLLCNILKKIYESSTYIIVGGNQTLVSIAYILHKWSTDFVCCSEISDLGLLIKEKRSIVILLTPNLIEQVSTCDVVLAMDCLSEFPKETIEYYFNNVRRLNPNIFYADYTNCSNGSFVENQFSELNNYNLEIDRDTPITAYMCPYISPNYDANDNMYEKLLQKKRENVQISARIGATGRQAES